MQRVFLFSLQVNESTRNCVMYDSVLWFSITYTPPQSNNSNDNYSFDKTAPIHVCVS